TVTSLAAGLRSDIGVKLLGADSAAVGQSLRLRQGPNRVRILIEQLHLVPGTYYLTLWVADHREVLDHIPAALQITVIPLAAHGYDLVPSDGVVTCSFRVEQ